MHEFQRLKLINSTHRRKLTKFSHLKMNNSKKFSRELVLIMCTWCLCKREKHGQHGNELIYFEGIFLLKYSFCNFQFPLVYMKLWTFITFNMAIEHFSSFQTGCNYIIYHHEWFSPNVHFLCEFNKSTKAKLLRRGFLSGHYFSQN